MTRDAIEFYRERFGITPADVDRLLGVALARGGDFADLYFEYTSTGSVQFEEQIVKTATRSVRQGVGVRVVVAERTGFAYTDSIDVGSIERAARTASSIARSGGSTEPVSVTVSGPPRDLYPVELSATDVDIAVKIEMLQNADAAARVYDRRIREVQAGVTDVFKIVMIATSEGVLTGDVQPMVRFGIHCIADDDGNRQVGRSGGGGRCGLDHFVGGDSPEAYAADAARQAIGQIEAVEAPSGTMEVVLGNGWPGILLHEAVGHGLEADFNRKGTSAFSGLIGSRVASDLCTVVDDGTIPGRRGSLNVDDEGHATSSTVLIEKGILRGYINDRLNAGLLGVARTGNGRRESYQSIPYPRMTNTFMLAGEDDPAEILRGVKRGLYAVQFGGGQVDITNGKFVFSASEAYLIEDGKVTAPVRGATLIGNGPDALTRVTAVGSDLALDPGIGICSKNGQGIPVGVGMPTIRISEMTVGGTKG
ncbi:MAG: metalloprotease TldD [Blastocatellia bacterium]|nr:metalloprotease TldD [Blastocatellia bacterium]